MRTHSPIPGAFRRWAPAVLALALAGTIGLLLVAFRGHGGGIPLGGAVPTATLTKVQEGDEMLATQQAMAREYGPKKTVIPQPSVTPPSSCPMGSMQTDIEPWAPPIGKGNFMTNIASIGATAQNPYNTQIYAGALGTNPQQGILIVFRQPEDPCAAKYANTGSLITYNTPYQKGALTLTAINGDSVSFSLADGGTGQFNYITNTYS